MEIQFLGYSQSQSEMPNTSQKIDSKEWLGGIYEDRKKYLTKEEVDLCYRAGCLDFMDHVVEKRKAESEGASSSKRRRT